MGFNLSVLIDNEMITSIHKIYTKNGIVIQE